MVIHCDLRSSINFVCQSLPLPSLTSTVVSSREWFDQDYATKLTVAGDNQLEITMCRTQNITIYHHDDEPSTKKWNSRLYATMKWNSGSLINYGHTSTWLRGRARSQRLYTVALFNSRLPSIIENLQQTCLVQDLILLIAAYLA